MNKTFKNTFETLGDPALPKNLIELLQFIPPCEEIRRLESGDWSCRLINWMTPEEVEAAKLKWGFTPGTVTPGCIIIHRSYLSK